MDTRTGGVKREFTNRDTHAVSAKVTKAEYSLAIGGDDDAGPLVRPVLQNFLDSAPVTPGDIKTPGFAVYMLKFLACLTNSGCVNQRHHFFDVIHHNPVKKDLVAVL